MENLTILEILSDMQQVGYVKHNSSLVISKGAPLVDSDGSDVFRLQIVPFGKWLNDNSTIKSRPIPFDVRYTIGSNLESKIILIMAYSIITAFAIIGNLLILWVLLGKHTTTERSLTPYFLNLAVSDLLMACFCIPFTFTQALLRRWMYGTVMCPLVLFMQVFSVTSSVFIYICIALDRFWAVLYPLKPSMGMLGSKVVLLIVWVAAGVFSAFQIFLARLQKRVRTSDNGEQYFVCNEVWANYQQRAIYSISMTCITYIIPLVLLGAMYIRICFALWRNGPMRGTNQRIEERQIRIKKKVIQMLLVTIVVFGVSWLPLNCINLIIDTFPDLYQSILAGYERQLAIAFFISHWLAMSHSCANFFIFVWFMKKFRSALMELTKTLCLRTIGRPSENSDSRNPTKAISEKRVPKRSNGRRFPTVLPHPHQTSFSEDPNVSALTKDEFIFPGFDDDKIEELYIDNMRRNSVQQSVIDRSRVGSRTARLGKPRTFKVDLDWQPMQEIGLLNNFVRMSESSIHNESSF